MGEKCLIIKYGFWHQKHKVWVADEGWELEWKYVNKASRNRRKGNNLYKLLIINIGQTVNNCFIFLFSSPHLIHTLNHPSHCPALHPLLSSIHIKVLSILHFVYLSQI